MKQHNKKGKNVDIYVYLGTVRNVLPQNLASEFGRAGNGARESGDKPPLSPPASS